MIRNSFEISNRRFYGVSKWFVYPINMSAVNI